MNTNFNILLHLFFLICCISNQAMSQIQNLSPRYTNTREKNIRVAIHPVNSMPLYMGYDSIISGIFLINKSTIRGKNEIYIFDDTSFKLKKKYLLENNMRFSSIKNHFIVEDEKNLKLINYISDQVTDHPYKRVIYVLPLQNFYVLENTKSGLLSIMSIEDHNSTLNIDVKKGKSTGYAVDSTSKYFFVVNEGLHINHIDTKSELHLPATTSTYNLSKVVGEVLFQAFLTGMSVGLSPRSVSSRLNIDLTYDTSVSSNNTLYGYHSNPIIQDSMLYWFASDRAYKVDLVHNKIIWEKKLTFEDHGLNVINFIDNTIHQVNLGFALHPGGKTPHAVASFRTFDAETGRSSKNFKISKNSSDLIQHYFFYNDTTLIIFFKDRIDMASLNSETIKTIKVYDKRKDGLFQGILFNSIFIKLNKDDEELILLSPSSEIVSSVCSNIITTFNKSDMKATILPIHSIYNIVGSLPDHFVIFKDNYSIVDKKGKVLHQFKADKYYGVINRRIYYYYQNLLVSIDPTDL